MNTRDFVCAQTSEELYQQPENVGINEFLHSCNNAEPTDDIWTVFYNKFDPWIQSYIRRALLVRNQQPTKETVEDITQDVYTMIFKLRSIERFRGTHENIFFGYLSIICINAVRLKLQSRRAIKRRASIIPLDTIQYTATRSFDPEEDIMAEMTISEVIERLEYLFKPRDVEIFWLFAVEGFNAQDLTSFGLKKSTIYGIVKNIRKRMRGLIV